MADFADVTAALAAAISIVVYPNGTDQPPAQGIACQISEGWPLPASLDKIAAKPNVVATNPLTLVSIYPVPNTTGDAGTGMDWSGEEVSRATAGLTAAVEDATITLAGTAAGTENVVVIINGTPYAFEAQAGDSAAVAANALFAAIAPTLPGSSIDYSAGPYQAVIDIVGARRLTARIGVTGILARSAHRERQQIRIVCWSSNPRDRNTIAKAIDGWLKATVRLPLPDGTASILTYSGSSWDDNQERAGLFRRDLIFTATCDSIELVEGVEITAVSFQVALPSGATLSTSS